MKFNYYAFKAIYLHEMDRFRRTLMQSLLSPVLSTSLYFIVFGSVIGGYVEKLAFISFEGRAIHEVHIQKGRYQRDSQRGIIVPTSISRRRYIVAEQKNTRYVLQ